MTKDTTTMSEELTLTEITEDALSEMTFDDLLGFARAIREGWIDARENGTADNDLEFANMLSDHAQYQTQNRAALASGDALLPQPSNESQEHG